MWLSAFVLALRDIRRNVLRSVAHDARHHHRRGVGHRHGHARQGATAHGDDRHRRPRQQHAARPARRASEHWRTGKHERAPPSELDDVARSRAVTGLDADRARLARRAVSASTAAHNHSTHGHGPPTSTSSPQLKLITRRAVHRQRAAQRAPPRASSARQVRNELSRPERSARHLIRVRRASSCSRQSELARVERQEQLRSGSRRRRGDAAAGPCSQAGRQRRHRHHVRYRRDSRRARDQGRGSRAAAPGARIWPGGQGRFHSHGHAGDHEDHRARHQHAHRAVSASSAASACSSAASGS